MKNAFRIGEIAELYGIGTDTVRYYEEQGLIKPQRAANGYRMYSIHDIWRMNVIRDLRGLGFSLERIKEYLGNRSIENTLNLLEEEKAAIEERMATLEDMHKNVEHRMHNLRKAQNKPTGIVEKINLPIRYCHQIEDNFSTDEEVDVLMKRLINKNPDRLYLIGSNNIGCRIPLSSIKKGCYREYNAAFLINGEGKTVIDGGLYLRLLYRGSSAFTAKYIPVLLSYAAANKLKPAGDILEFVWTDIHEAQNTNEHITELQICVEPI